MVTDAASGQVAPFPDSLRVRRYDAEFARGGATLKATDGSGSAIHIGGVDTYSGEGVMMTLKDGDLTILVPPANGRSSFGLSACQMDGFFWPETLSTGEFFALCGTWRASMADPARTEGTIAGTFEYYVNHDNLRAPLSCYATDHHFTLDPTGPSSIR